MDRLDALQVLVLAVEQGSLSAAARMLGKSAASVTRTLAALEARVGAKLLRRTTRSLRPTEAGERYLEVARRVLADLAAAETTTRASLESPQGLLTVTAPLAFGGLHVRPLVDAFVTTYPDVRARLLLLDRVVNVVDEGIDVAVRIAHLPDSALVAVPLGEVRRVCCASQEYLKRHGRPRVPSDLGGHRCITLAPVTPVESWTFGPREGERARQVRVHPVLTTNVVTAALGSARAGIGVTCALSYQVERSLREGTLVRLLAAFEPPPLPVHLVYTAASATSAKVRRFLELATPRLRDVLRSARRPA